MLVCSRRRFFGLLGRSLAADLADAVATLRPQRTARAGLRREPPSAHRSLRPPGALPEAEFLATCTRCTACQDACPYESVRRLGPEFGDKAGTPVIIPDESPCYLCEDMPCITACEPRALRPVPRHDVAMGLAVMDLKACYVAQGQPCDYCVARCPLGPEAIQFNDRGLPEVRELGCTGCGVCAYLCPAKAIAITPKNGT